MAGENDSADAGRLYREARLLMDEGRFAEAIATFHKSNDLSPHFKTLELLGECYIHSGQLVKSIVPLAAAVGLNKGGRAASILADVFLSLGYKHEANEMADKALSRNPGNRKALEVKTALADFIARTDSELSVSWHKSRAKNVWYR